MSHQRVTEALYDFLSSTIRLLDKRDYLNLAFRVWLRWSSPHKNSLSRGIRAGGLILIGVSYHSFFVLERSKTKYLINIIVCSSFTFYCWRSFRSDQSQSVESSTCASGPWRYAARMREGERWNLARAITDTPVALGSFSGPTNTCSLTRTVYGPQRAPKSNRTINTHVIHRSCFYPASIQLFFLRP